MSSALSDDLMQIIESTNSRAEYPEVATIKEIMNVNRYLITLLSLPIALRKWEDGTRVDEDDSIIVERFPKRARGPLESDE
jgi:hypothetical protein